MKPYQAPVVKSATEGHQEFMDERIAIRIYDGGLTENQARQGAMDDLVRYLERGGQ